MPTAVHLAEHAARCLRGLGADRARRLVLSLFFKAALGIERIFHFDTQHDPGLAVLTGGTRVLGRNALGSLLRAAPVRGVLRLVHATEPVVRRVRRLGVSLDEHVLARFTRKFRIPEGFHALRNKHMKVEKLFFSYALTARTLLSVIVTRGDARLATVAQALLARLRRRARGATLRVVLDAGASGDHAQLGALVSHQRQVTLARVPRHRSYRKAWEALPPSAWTRHLEPGPSTHAPPKVVHVAETRTRLHLAGRDHAPTSVRTVVVREATRKGKERWHALWIFHDERTPAYALVKEFRQRQRHEQRYRMMARDTFVDAAPSGYSKASPNPDRPGFRQNALTLYAWVTSLATDALVGLSNHLDEHPRRWHPRTVRRWLLQVPAEMYLAPDILHVVLLPHTLRGLWEHLVRRANRRPLRIPWMGNRKLLLSLDRSPGQRPEVTIAPKSRPQSVR